MTVRYAGKARDAKLRTVAREGHEIVVDAETSLRMAGIRQRDTKPELIVRKIVTALGHRYRVQNGTLPGRPDLANRSRSWVIFVHGCFWHRHRGCKRTTTPKRNREFWEAKFDRNVARDKRVQKELRADGFRILVVWECETREPEKLLKRVRGWFARIGALEDE